MIAFVNAKINIGLQIVRKRADGYHDLQTVFYPVGIHAGNASNPGSFCDILECVSAAQESKGTVMPEIEFRGRVVDCPLEKNLVYKAAKLFQETTGIDCSGVKLILEKHLPDGAGMGGGSADASFTLRMLSEYYGVRDLRLQELALKLGADCPFFIENKAVYAEGVGECFSDIMLDLSGKWLVVVKPEVYISTKEAFAGVTPRSSEFDLKELGSLPIESWRDVVKNDFEDSIFPQHPELKAIKASLYSSGALYASMSGSGSSIYGIYDSKAQAEQVINGDFGNSTISQRFLLEL